MINKYQHVKARSQGSNCELFASPEIDKWLIWPISFQWESYSTIHPKVKLNHPKVFMASPGMWSVLDPPDCWWITEVAWCDCWHSLGTRFLIFWIPPLMFGNSAVCGGSPPCLLPEVNPRCSIKGRRKFQEVRALLGVLLVRAGDARTHQVTSRAGAEKAGDSQ